MAGLPTPRPDEPAADAAPSQAEQDRRSGLSRVLEAIAAVQASLDATGRDLAALRERVAALEAGGPGLAAGAVDDLVDRVADAVAARPVRAVVDPAALRAAVAAAVAEADVPSTAEHVQALVTTALSVLPAPVVDVEGLARALRTGPGRIGGGTDEAVDLGPVVEAVDALRRDVAAGPGEGWEATVAQALTRALGSDAPAGGSTGESGPVLDPGEVADLVVRRLGDDLALATGGAIGGQEVLVDLVRRTVAASHRALVAQLGTLLDGIQDRLAGDQAAMVSSLSMDVEAIRRAIERAGGSTRGQADRPQPPVGPA